MTFRVTSAAIALTVICFTSSNLTAQTAYEVVEVPTLPGHPFSRTSRINNQGHVVGGNWTCPFILSCLGRAFLYDGADSLDFSAGLIDDVPPGFFGVTRGVDINDDGDVLLWLTIIDIGVFPYLWRDGEEFVEIEGPPGSLGAIGWALNESGEVAGHYTTPSGSRAFVWTADDGVIEIIDPNPGFASSLARGINDAGDVVGIFSGGSPSRGFVRSNGVVTVLEPLPGDVESQAIDITETGLVVGESTDADFSDSLVLWKDGKVVDSLTLRYEQVLIEIHQVSDQGVVVGSYWPLPDAFQHFAFRWSTAAGFQQLDELDLSIPDLNLWQATGINDSGQIAVWGEYPGFIAGQFLLLPVDSIVGDLDGDGVVSVTDLMQLLAAWGPCADPDDCPEDLNGDRSVTVQDLITLLGNWG